MIQRVQRTPCNANKKTIISRCGCTYEEFKELKEISKASPELHISIPVLCRNLHNYANPHVMLISEQAPIKACRGTSPETLDMVASRGEDIVSIRLRSPDEGDFG